MKSPHQKIYTYLTAFVLLGATSWQANPMMGMHTLPNNPCNHPRTLCCALTFLASASVYYFYIPDNVWDENSLAIEEPIFEQNSYTNHLQQQNSLFDELREVNDELFEPYQKFIELDHYNQINEVEIDIPEKLIFDNKSDHIFINIFFAELYIPFFITFLMYSFCCLFFCVGRNKHDGYCFCL